MLGADGKPVPGGRHKTPKDALAHLRALEANVSDAKKVMLPAVKIGARNNASDKQTIQAIHDNACDLGADCQPMDMNEGITAMINGKSIKSNYSIVDWCQQCIYNCVACIRQCKACGSTDDLHRACMQACRNCITECSICSTDCSGNASAAQCVESCKTCTEACMRCKAACEALAGSCPECAAMCQSCAGVCGECAEECARNAGLELDADNDNEAGEENETPMEAGPNITATYEGDVLFKSTTTIPAQVKTVEETPLNLSYAKSLGLAKLPDLAVKYVAKDTIRHPIFLWGNPELTDLEHEFFTRPGGEKGTDLWDEVLGKSPRPLTWDHAQDPDFKADPLIGQTNEWEDDEIARWGISVLKKGHQYRRAIDSFIGKKSLGSAAIALPVVGASSDSAPQYVQRVKVGNAIWLKRWPWFATALTPAPCEPRMIDSSIGGVDFVKSLGIQLPDAATWDAEAAMFDYYKLKLT